MQPTLLVLALMLGIVAALCGGAVSGIRIGSAALGKELAALMGALYGVLAGTAGVLAGLAILQCI